ncbi:MAG: A24 family peptidase [Gammaproteobacteria bacterium]|nr:A24 family peptidase [Gammaproteobacteria bacterium]
MNTLLFVSNHFIATIVFVLIFGATIGSFLNVVIYRYPIMLIHQWNNDCLAQLNQALPMKTEAFNLCVPQSHCPNCKKHIPFWLNIPIIGYVLLAGKCRLCRSPISLQYLLVEIISALLSVIVFLHFGISLPFFEVLLLTYGLIVLSFIDFNHQFLPDTITFSLLWLGLIVSTQHYFTSPSDAIFGTITAYVFLWGIAKLFLLLRKKEGMGLGDCKMLAMCGAWVGTTALLNIVLLSTVSALFVSLILLGFKKIDGGKHIPFGPFIAIALWYTVVYGPQLNFWIASWLT